jgi:hypothetical protein
MTEETGKLAKKLLTHRRFAAVEDVIDHIQSNYATRGTIGVFFRQQSALRARTNRDTEGTHRYFNKISFVVGPSGVRRFCQASDAIQAKHKMEQLVIDQKLQVHEFANLALFWSSEFHDEEVSAFGTLLISFYSAADVDANQIEASTRFLVRQDVRGPGGLRDIVGAVMERFAVQAAYYISSTREPATGLETGPDFELIARTDNSQLRRLLAIKQVQDDAHGSLEKGLSYSGRVHDGSERLYYKVVPVSFLDLLGEEENLFDPRAIMVAKRRLSPPRRRVGAIILVDHQPVEALCFSYAAALVDEFIGAVSHAIKISTLQRLSESRIAAQLRLLAALIHRHGSDSLAGVA